MNIFTRILDFVKFNGGEMEWVKFNGATIYEAWKKLIAKGIPPLTLPKCKGVDLVDYKIKGNSVQGKLPSEYQQVEYIESTGKQSYLITDYYLTKNSKIVFDVKPMTSSATGFIPIFSTRPVYSCFGYTLDKGLGGDIATTITTSITSTQYIAPMSFDRFTIEYNTNGLIKKDGEIIYNPISNPRQEKWTSPVRIFSINDGDLRDIKCKLYSFKIYENEILSFNLVPCYRKSDNVIGMYDLVNDKFCHNAGTGTFNKGNNTPTPDNPIEIQSIGEKTKNIWDEQWLTGNIQVGNSVNSSTAYRSANYISVKPNTTYTFNTTTYGNIFVFEYDENKAYLNKVTGITANSHKFTTNSGTGYIRFANRNMPTYQGDVIINEGNVDIDYEPYGYKMPIKVSGKNLFNYKNYIKNGFSKEIENGIQFEITNSRIDIDIDFTFKANTTYVLSAECTENANLGGKFNADFTGFIWCNKEQKQLIIKNSRNTDVTMPIICVDTNGTKGSTIKFAMLEQGTQISNYEPYIEPITTNIYIKEPLRKIGDNADYIDFEKGKVIKKIFCITKTAEELKAIGEHSLRGQRFWETGYPAANIELSPENRAKSTIGSYGFAYGYNGKLHWYVGDNASASNNAFVIVSPDENTTIGEYFTSMNLQTDIDFMYVMKTPLPEPITLPNIPTFKGTTIIEVDTTIQPSNMEAEYYGKK